MVVLGAAPHKANLVARYRGKGAARPLLLLAHLDVVEAKREDWSFDPFTLLEKDGYFYGRGTGDDKAQAAIWVANLIRYRREGLAPARDLIVALTADEEGGGPYNGVDWLLKNRRDLIDAELLPERGRLGRDAGREAPAEPHASGGEALGHLSPRGEEPGRPQLACRCGRTRSTGWRRRYSASPRRSSSSG